MIPSPCITITSNGTIWRYGVLTHAAFAVHHDGTICSGHSCAVPVTLNVRVGPH
jgi:hypothetical protein